MKLQLRADVQGMYFSGGAIVDIPELLTEAFEPLKICDDPMFSAICREPMPHSEEVKMVMKIRENAADILSKELTKLILGEMSKLDTSNGYR